MKLARTMPRYVPLIATDMVRLAISLKQTSDTRELLEQYAIDSPALDVMEALVQLDQADGAEDVQSRYANHMAKEPSVVAARLWVAHEPLQHESHRAALERALDRAAQPLKRYRCAACGFEAQRHFWQCPGCQAWDSYPPRRVEEL